MSPFRLAVLNLIRRRLPTLIAIGAIAISIASSGILLKLHRLSSSRFSTIAEGGNAVVGAKGDSLDILLGSLNLEGNYPGFIPYNLFLTLRARVPVQFADGTVSRDSYLRSIIPIVSFALYHHFRVIGTDESFLNRPTHPLSVAQGQWCEGLGEVVVGSGVASSRHLKIGDVIKTQIWTRQKPGPGTVELHVVGILKPTHSMWDQALYATLEQAHQVLAAANVDDLSVWGANVLQYFLIYAQPEGLSQLKKLINQRTVSQVISVPAELHRLHELTGTGQRLGLFMTLAIMAVGGLTVAAMMVTRFDAMNVQLAILRAIGYSRREIAQWLLWEGILLGGIAVLLGAILDWLLFPWIRSLLGTALPSADLVPIALWASFPVWGAAIVMTILAVVIPLYRLYRQDVHLSLQGL